jgi:N-acetylneuraminic acid mutarotase
MRYHKLYLLVIILITISCEKDASLVSKKYPFVVMKTAQVSEQGVEFVAEIKEMGDYPVARYGFRWNAHKSDQYYYKTIDGKARPGEYSLMVPSDLVVNEDYYVRPFVITENNLTVFGNDIPFISKGASSPIITDFEPKSGNSGDTITIYGKNFSVMKSRIKVRLGSDVTTVIFADFNVIKVVIPQRLTSSDEVPIYLTSGSSTLKSSDLFSIKGHRITSFYPQEGFIGETVVEITGTGFDSAYTVVKFGNDQAKIINANGTKIRVRLPYAVTPGDQYVEVVVKGRTTTSENQFTCKTRWTTLNSTPFILTGGGCFMKEGDFGYCVAESKYSGTGTDFWGYDFKNDQWTNLEKFPGAKRTDGVGFVVNGKVYYGLGIDNGVYLNDFWEYNIQTKIWRQKSKFIGAGRYRSMSFALNNKGYLIGGIGKKTPNTNAREVWEYNPELDLWYVMGSIPNSIAYYIDNKDVCLYAQDKVYIIPTTSSATQACLFYKFDPTNASFLVSQGITLPAGITGESIPAFLIDDRLYVGENTSGVTKSAFWKCNLADKTWTQIESFPGGSMSFFKAASYGNMGYVMFSPTLQTMWGYDETKLK